MNIQVAVREIESFVASPQSRDAQRIIETSRDFYEVEDYDERRRVEAEFARHYESVVAELTRTWGSPTFQGSRQDEVFPEWAAEEMTLLTSWQFEPCMVYVAIEDHDKELPLQLVVGVHEV